MENLSDETVRQSLQTLQDVLRCSICLETVRQDFVHCDNLHLTCSECKVPNTTSCPLCRQPFSPGKPPGIIIQVVEALPPRCKYQNCRKYLETDDDHEKYCGFKVTTCKICKWIGPGKEILQHMRECHTDRQVFTHEITPGTWPSFQVNKRRFSYCPILCYGHFFWMKFLNDPETKLLSITFYLVCDGKPKCNIFVKLAFSSEEVPEFICKIKLKIDEDGKEDNNIICVPRVFLPYFINNETKALKFKISITKE